jgi:hypothetical protein
MTKSPTAAREIAVAYRQTGEGLPEGGKEGRLSLRAGTLEPKMFLPCANPACKKGGFVLRAGVDKIVAAGEAEGRLALACAGYVGAVRGGEGAGARCPNRLEATVTVAYAKR